MMMMMMKIQLKAREFQKENSATGMVEWNLFSATAGCKSSWPGMV